MKILLICLILWLIPVFISTGAAKSFKLDMSSSDFTFLFFPILNYFGMIWTISEALEKYIKE